MVNIKVKVKTIDGVDKLVTVDNEVYKILNIFYLLIILVIAV